MRYLFILAILYSCISTSSVQDGLVSVQIIDRNGFSETISSKDRLESFEKTDFLANQPYQKVLRVFKQGKEGGGTSKISSYHDNGQIWQYLEVENGRAHGAFREWHPNGHLRLEATVIGGTADITEAAQMTWLFDGTCRVW